MVLLNLKDNNSFRQSWKNFKKHVDEKFEQFEQLHKDMASIHKNKAWIKLRDQELAVWLATIHMESSASGLMQNYHLEFPDSDSLIAFELAWS
jgi:hypothetical protein